MGNCFAANRTVVVPKYEECVDYIPTEGVVVKVYDGDTFTLAVYMSDVGKWTKWSVRLAGIDCPEMRPKNTIEKEVTVYMADTNKWTTKTIRLATVEKEIALKAKAFVENAILHKRVQLRNVSKEKYGRILADVFVSTSDVSLNQQLLKQRLAVPYDGGTKHVPEDWNAYFTNSA
jgi:endonuclease YncB( thermonuclease family)